MDNFWMEGLGDQPFYGGFSGGDLRASQARSKSQAELVKHSADVKELQHQVERLALLNQALWELLRERAGLTDADLETKAREVDMRDGVEDGKLTTVAVKCPKCMRVNNSKHHKCLYCGQLFEKPLFG